MIFIASDHAGFSLKEFLIQKLQAIGKEVVDLGTDSDKSTDYPDYAFLLAAKIQETSGSFGVLVCGTGVGMSIAANKVAGLRAACVSEPVSAQMSREHNDAQVLCLGARIISKEKAWECVEAFLEASFDDQHPRHKRRIQKIADKEKSL